MIVYVQIADPTKEPKQYRSLQQMKYAPTTDDVDSRRIQSNKGKTDHYPEGPESVTIRNGS